MTRRMTRRMTPAASRLCAALIAAAALTAGSLAPAQARVADPMYAAPAPGTCFTYTVDDGMDRYQTSAPVSCDEGTAKVLYAGPAATGKKTGYMVPGKVTRTCDRRLLSTVGGTAKQRALTMYAMFAFSADEQQMEAGARWWRCDVTLWAGSRLTPLARGGNFLHDGINDFERRCFNARTVVSCHQPHSWRSSRAVWVPGRTMPTKAQFLAFGRRKCPPGTPFSWMRPALWNDGDHYVICYRRDHY